MATTLVRNCRPVAGFVMDWGALLGTVEEQEVEWHDQDEEIPGLQERGEQALVELLDKYQGRLERLIRLRLDRRLLGRVDVQDVLQEAYLAARRRLPGFLERPSVPAYVWLRQITLHVLTDVHRFHWGARMRSVELEVPLNPGALPRASSQSLAAHLVDNLTSPSGAAAREESLAQLRKALESMDPIDREVLALRHFEELGNNDVARVLDIQVTAASMRYIRALKRLRSILPSSLRSEDAPRPNAGSTRAASSDSSDAHGERISS